MARVLPDIIQIYQSITVFSCGNTHSCLLPRNLAVCNGAETPSILWGILLKNLVKNSLVWSYFLGCYSFGKFALLVQASYLNENGTIFPGLKSCRK